MPRCGLNGLSGEADRGRLRARVLGGDIASDGPQQVKAALGNAEHAPKSIEVVTQPTDADYAQLNQRVTDHDIGGYLKIDDEPGQTTPVATWVSGSSTDFIGKSQMESAVTDGLVREQLLQRGMSDAQVKTLMTNMESVFKKIFPTTDFQSRFFDESLEQLYTQERQTAQIMNIAMGVAIFVSCMGLFGLAAFTANQRTREIGIRKVLGAGVPHLVSLLSREFILLVGFATVIAAPLAGWGVHQWLQNYAYRTSIPWWIFVLAGLAAVVIALLTVSYQAIRAATANPVKSLRVE